MGQQNSTPKWKKKLTEQISRLRAEASRIDQYLRGTPSRRLRHRLNLIKRKYKLRSDQELSSKLTEIKLLITTFGAMKKMWKSRSLSVDLKRELYERIVVPTVMYGSESWGMKVEERGKLDVAEMKCLRSMCGV